MRAKLLDANGLPISQEESASASYTPEKQSFLGSLLNFLWNISIIGPLVSFVWNIISSKPEKEIHSEDARDQQTSSKEKVVPVTTPSQTIDRPIQDLGKKARKALPSVTNPESKQLSLDQSRNVLSETKEKIAQPHLAQELQNTEMRLREANRQILANKLGQHRLYAFAVADSYKEQLVSQAKLFAGVTCENTRSRILGSIVNKLSPTEHPEVMETLCYTDKSNNLYMWKDLGSDGKLGLRYNANDTIDVLLPDQSLKAEHLVLMGYKDASEDGFAGGQLLYVKKDGSVGFVANSNYETPSLSRNVIRISEQEINQHMNNARNAAQAFLAGREFIAADILAIAPTEEKRVEIAAPPEPKTIRHVIDRQPEHKEASSGQRIPEEAEAPQQPAARLIPTVIDPAIVAPDRQPTLERKEPLLVAPDQNQGTVISAASRFKERTDPKPGLPENIKVTGADGAPIFELHCPPFVEPGCVDEDWDQHTATVYVLKKKGSDIDRDKSNALIIEVRDNGEVRLRSGFCEDPKKFVHANVTVTKDGKPYTMQLGDNIQLLGAKDGQAVQTPVGQNDEKSPFKTPGQPAFMCFINCCSHYANKELLNKPFAKEPALSRAM